MDQIENEVEEVVRAANGKPVLDSDGDIQTVTNTTVTIERCGCQRYVGPEPLRTLYAENLADVAMQSTKDGSAVDAPRSE